MISFIWLCYLFIGVDYSILYGYIILLTIHLFFMVVLYCWLFILYGYIIMVLIVHSLWLYAVLIPRQRPEGGCQKSTSLKVSGMSTVNTVHTTVSMRASPSNSLAWFGFQGFGDLLIYYSSLLLSSLELSDTKSLSLQ